MKLADFQLDDEETRDALEARLRELNATVSDYPRDRTIHELFAERARQTPDAIAVCGAGWLTYGEVEACSNQIARWLLAQGTGAGGVVGILVGRSPWVVPALLGVLKAGAAYLPLDPGAPLDRLIHAMDDGRAACVITRAPQAALAGKLAETSGHVLCLGDAPVARPLAPARVLEGLSTAALAPVGSARSLAYVIYTSGSTGRPKGVLIEHRAVVRLVCESNFVRLGPNDRVLQTGSLAFDASTFELWGPLLNGGSVHLAEKADFLDPVAFGALLATPEITTIFLTTILFNTVLECCPGAFAGLRTVLMGGEKVSPRHVRRFHQLYPHVRLLHVYGPTENTTFSTFHEVVEPNADDIPIGGPIANSTVWVLNDELEPVEPGGSGELLVGGDGLARGYLNHPALTAERFVPHPFGHGERLYRTGDWVRWTDDGLEFLHRMDGQVKIRGYRIELSEIEVRLREHPAVRQCAVRAWEDGKGGRSLAAYFTAETPVGAPALRAWLKETLPAYMAPARFIQLAQLPINQNGKVDREALPPPASPVEAPAETDDAVWPTYALVRELWEQVVTARPIRLDDDFFELGGHSLTAMQLASHIKNRFGILIPLTTIFHTPTVRAMGDFLMENARFGRTEIDAPMVRLHDAPEEPVIFAFPPGTADALGYTRLASLLRPLAFHAFNFVEAETRWAAWADLIEESAAGRPFALFGYSGGGNLAYHVAQELERRGVAVCALVLLDAAAFPEPYAPLAAGGTALAESFLASPEAQEFLTSPVLRDKARRNIERYHECLAGLAQHGTVACRIHLVASEDSPAVHRDPEGRVICSTERWVELGAGGFVEHSASGGHNELLYAPHLEANACRLKAIFDAAFAFPRAALLA